MIKLKSAFQIFWGWAPKQGPKALPVLLELASATSFTFDVEREIEGDIISFIQSVFVDNSLNPNEVVITYDVFQQPVKCPARSQGIFPAIISGSAKFTASSDGGVNVPIIFFNVPLPYAVWNLATSSPPIPPTTGATVTNHSGDIAVGGTSQIAIAANADRLGWSIQNPVTNPNTESLYIDFGVAADPATSFEIPPGGMLTNADIFGDVVFTGQIQIVGATAGTVYIAKELEQ